MTKKQTIKNPTETIGKLADLARHRGVNEWAGNDDRANISERWESLAKGLEALCAEWHELSHESSQRAYGRIYGTVGADGIKRYDSYDRNGNPVVIVIP